MNRFLSLISMHSNYESITNNKIMIIRAYKQRNIKIIKFIIVHVILQL